MICCLTLLNKYFFILVTKQTFCSCNYSTSMLCVSGIELPWPELRRQQTSFLKFFVKFLSSSTRGGDFTLLLLCANYQTDSL